MRGERSELPLVSSCRQNSNRSPVGRVLTRLPFRQSPVGRVLTRLLSPRSLVGRVLTRLLFRRSPVGRVLTRRSSADIKIKSFRAVTARATFLCLCKETWRKESTPRLRARCFAPGPRSRRDFPRRHPASAENAAHP